MRNASVTLLRVSSGQHCTNTHTYKTIEQRFSMRYQSLSLHALQPQRVALPLRRTSPPQTLHKREFANAILCQSYRRKIT
jgi:hypothetical protein